MASIIDDRGIIVACCDGHGSRQSFRSAEGARMAAEIAIRHGAALFATEPELEFTDVHQTISDAMREITLEWTAAVVADVASHPFDVDTDPQIGPQPHTPSDLTRVYGTTLLLSLCTGSRAIVAQIGDGDIFAVDRTGTPIRPIPDDPRFIAGETTSLCLPEAWRETRVAVLDLVDHDIEFIVLATDGYGNTFADATWRDQVAHDFFAQLREHGPDWIAARLDDWLGESAAVGGDDVTLALVIPPEPRAAAPSIEAAADVTTEPEPEPAVEPDVATEPEPAADFVTEPVLRSARSGMAIAAVVAIVAVVAALILAALGGLVLIDRP
jgi:serine/threonine protein phosphatase PrpC